MSNRSDIPENMRFDPSTLGLNSMTTKTSLDEFEVKTKSIEELLPLPTLKYRGNRVTISQSLLKETVKMQEGDMCGKKFFHRWFLKETTDSEESNALRMGKRFEFELCGAKDAFGNVPEELVTKAKREPSSDQKRISENARLANEVLKSHGFKVTEPLEDDEMKGRVKRGFYIGYQGIGGTLDHLTFKNRERCIVDFKYSGLIGDEWSDFGWNTENENRANYITKNRQHTTQATHYTLLYYLKFKKILPFYFAVFDNRAGKEGNHKIIRIDVSEKAMVEHLERIHETVATLRAELKSKDGGFEANGNYKQCSKCLVQDCKARKGLPEIVTLTI